MIGAEVREVFPTERRNTFGETRQTDPKLSADHSATPAGLGKFGGFSDKTPWARAYKKVKYNTTTIVCKTTCYPEYRKSLFSKKEVWNFGKTSKPLLAPIVDAGQRHDPRCYFVTELPKPRIISRSDQPDTQLSTAGGEDR
jgi:hypothetical protein